MGIVTKCLLTSTLSNFLILQCYLFLNLTISFPIQKKDDWIIIKNVVAHRLNFTNGKTDWNFKKNEMIHPFIQKFFIVYIPVKFQFTFNPIKIFCFLSCFINYLPFSDINVRTDAFLSKQHHMHAHHIQVLPFDLFKIPFCLNFPLFASNCPHTDKENGEKKEEEEATRKLKFWNKLKRQII